MKKSDSYRWGAFILLLLYGISLAPSFVIHDHRDEYPVFVNASSCERTIYFSGALAADCKHDHHLTSGHNKCNYCDHHTPLYGKTADWRFNILTADYLGKIESAFHHFHASSLYESTGRAPPAIVS